MTKALRPASRSQADAVETAYQALQAALTALTEADCPRTADKVRAALKSCDGARRHVRRRLDSATAMPISAAAP